MVGAQMSDTRVNGGFKPRCEGFHKPSRDEHRLIMREVVTGSQLSFDDFTQHRTAPYPLRLKKAYVIA